MSNVAGTQKYTHSKLAYLCYTLSILSPYTFYRVAHMDNPITYYNVKLISLQTEQSQWCREA